MPKVVGEGGVLDEGCSTVGEGDDVLGEGCIGEGDLEEGDVDLDLDRMIMLPIVLLGVSLSVD